MCSISPLGAAHRRWTTAVLGSLLLFSTGCPNSHRARQRSVDPDGSADELFDADLDRPEEDDEPDATPEGGEADAGEAALDAGEPSDAESDAGESDASFDASDDVEVVPEVWPDLVFIRSGPTGSSLHTLNVRDFGAERRLDPQPALSADTASPLGYAPDGRKLLVQEIRGGSELVFFVSYPCRADPCLEPASYASVLAAPGAELKETLFAPDSSGVALRLGTGLWYVALGASGPTPAVRLVDGSTESLSFLRGGGALLAQHGAEVLVFDLARAAPAAVPTYRVQGTRSGGIPPDGEHFAVRRESSEWFALTTLDVIEGRATERRIAGDGVTHTTNARLIVRDEGVYRIERWDGSDPASLPAQDPAGCGERVIACKDGAAVRIELPGPESFAGTWKLTSIPELPCQNGRFLAGCQQYVSFQDGGDVLYDWAQGVLHTSFELFQSVSFDDGQLLHVSSVGGGLDTVLSSAGGSVGTAYSARTPLLQTYPVLAQHSPFLIAAGPLESPLDPGLYQVDMSAPLPARVRRLVPERMSSNTLRLSADDRYLAYRVGRPNVPSAWDASMAGVFELDLQTGTRRRISPVSNAPAGGPLRMHVLPERRSVLVYGAYESSGVARYYTAHLNAPDGWRSQTPPGREGWVDEGSGFPSYAYSGTLGLLGGAGIAPTGPGVWLQSLELSAAQAPRIVGNFVDSAFTGAYARDKSYNVQGLARGLGLLFTVPEEVGSEWREPALQRIDPVSGAVETIVQATRSVHVSVVAERSGRVFASRSGQDGLDYGYVDASEPTRWMPLLQTSREVLARLSPQERWLVFTESESLELHCLELATGTHHVLALPSRATFTRVGGLYSFEIATFADDTRALVRLEDGSLHELALGAAPQLTRVLEGLQRTTDLAASKNLERLVSYGYRQPAIYYDRKRAARSVLFAPDQWSTDVTLSPDGRWILARLSGGEWQRFAASDPKAPQALAGSDSYPTLRFDKSGQHLLGLSSREHAVLVWRLAIPSEPHALGAPGEVTDVAFVD